MPLQYIYCTCKIVYECAHVTCITCATQMGAKRKPNPAKPEKSSYLMAMESVFSVTTRRPSSS